MDPLSVVASTFSGLTTAFKLVEFGLLIKDVPIDSRIFVELAASVEADLEHALACKREIGSFLSTQPDHHREWINGTILRTLKALNEIGCYVLDVQVEQEKNPSLSQRLNYVLLNYKKLVDREKWLRASHGSLLAALNAMHIMLYQNHDRQGREGIPAHSPIRSSMSDQNSMKSPVPTNLRGRQISAVPSRDTLASTSTQSLPSTIEYELEGSTSPFTRTAAPRAEIRSHTTGSPYSLSETDFSELSHVFSEPQTKGLIQRPSRQKPRPRIQSSSSDNFVVSTNAKLDNISRTSISSEPLSAERRPLVVDTTMDEKIATSIAYGEILEYLQILRRQSFRGDVPGVKIYD